MMKSDNINQLLNWTFMRKATAADIVRRIQTGDNPNEHDGEESTPLHKAIQARNFDAFRALVESGADPSVLSESEYDFEIEQAIRNSNGYSDLSNLRKIQTYLGGMSAGQRAALHERAERARIQKERKKADWKYRCRHGLWHPKLRQYILPEEGRLYEELKKAEERKTKINKICDLIMCATMSAGVLGSGAAILYFCLLSHITEENRKPKKDPVAEVAQANTNQTIVVTRQNQTTNMAAQVYRERAQQMK